MAAWFDSLTALQTVFAVMAGVSALFFIVQVVMMIVGGFGDSDIDTGVEAGVDADTDGSVGDHSVGEHADSTADFHWISIQGITAFFMMFGLVGLMLNKGHGWGAGGSIGLGMLAGVLTNFAVAKIFQMFRNLQSSGTMDLRNALGQEGTVYLTIKKDEPGKIQIPVQEHLRVFEAVSEDGSVIPTDSRIKVVKVVNGNIMVVKRIGAAEDKAEE